MPLYEYECDANGHHFEIIQKSFSDPPPERCPTCGSPVHKLMSSPAIQFKGTGWYVTDYARKGETGAKDAKSAKGGDPSDSKDSKDSRDSKDSKDSKETKSDSTSKTDTSSSSSAANTTPASTSTPKE